MTDVNPDDLVDHTLTNRATERSLTARDRFTTAEADLVAAKANHATAAAASRRAVEGMGPVSAIDAEHLLNAAATALTVAQKVRDAAERLHHEANEGRGTARAMAWAPVYMEGIRRRVGASRKADTARALLAEADAEHLAAETLMRTAASNGTPHIGNAHHGHRVLRTEAEEIKLWAAEGVDATNPVHPWKPSGF